VCIHHIALQLGQFLPGALVKVPYSDKLARVADPFRQPEELLGAVSAPVGSMSDKLALLPLILKEKTTSVDQIFKEEETDTLDLLTRKWFISDVLLEGACLFFIQYKADIDYACGYCPYSHCCLRPGRILFLFPCGS
jgi:hypothetical protein